MLSNAELDSLVQEIKKNLDNCTADTSTDAYFRELFGRTLDALVEYRQIKQSVPQTFSPGTKVRLKGDLSPWKTDPQKGAEGVVISHEHGIVALKFDNYGGVRYSYPEGLEIVGE